MNSFIIILNRHFICSLMRVTKVLSNLLENWAQVIDWNTDLLTCCICGKNVIRHPLDFKLDIILMSHLTLPFIFTFERKCIRRMLSALFLITLYSLGIFLPSYSLDRWYSQYMFLNIYLSIDSIIHMQNPKSYIIATVPSRWHCL